MPSPFVADVSGFSGGIGDLISDQINQRIQKKALGGDESAMARLASRDPRASAQVGSILQGRQDMDAAEKEKQQKIKAQIARVVAGAGPEGAGEALRSILPLIRSNPELAAFEADIIEDIERSDADPQSVFREYKTANDFFSDPQAVQRSAAQREFEALIGGFTPEEQEQARRVKARIAAPAVGSGAITAATTEGLTKKVAESGAIIAGQEATATETAKLSVQREIKPKIEAAITTARMEAQKKGEKLSDLQRAKAALPGLKEVTAKLKDLAPLATSTLGEKVFDEGAKQLGFGATKGSTARAKFIAVVDNEVLPLLKATFGAAFTFQEGQALKATLGDPDASPAEKNAQLDAFIEAKIREIETKEREIQPTAAGQGDNISDADLLNKYGIQ